MSAQNPFAKPDLMTAKRILAVQPHYDDNDIAAGGTLAALAARGAEVYYLTVTDDLVGFLDQSLPEGEMTTRLEKEQKEAGAIIGVKEHYWLGYPDAGRFDHLDLRAGIIRHIRLLHPDLIFTCDPWLPYEAHYDHRRTGFAAAEAAILYNFTRLKTDPAVDEKFKPYDLMGAVFYASAHPNTVFDITQTREKKHKALDCYKAQFSAEDMAGLHLVLGEREQEAAKGRGFSHGEPLKALPTLRLHVDPEAWKM